MLPFEWIEQAATRISPYIIHTTLTRTGKTPQEAVYLKWENRQVTGSFKARGAFNKVLSLQEWELAQGLVTASAGNHGQGVALAGKITGTKATIFASDHAVPAKVDAMRALGAEVHLVPGGYGDAEQAGIAFARSTGGIWISPYNDGQVIAGQGTLALEILQNEPVLRDSTWVVPAGGGGLVSGIGAALVNIAPHARLVAVQSEASPFLQAIYRYGSQEGVIELPSLADGLAGPVENNSITVPLVRRFVDEFILVTEEEITQAIAICWHEYKEKIEGSAAAALAAILNNKVKDRPAVVVITGGNIQPELHQQILAHTSKG